MAPRKDTEQSDDWRNQAGQGGQGGGNRQQGQRENLTGGNQQSDKGSGNKQSDVGQGQRQGSRDDLQDEEYGNRGNRGGRDQQR
jgi:hypothetical protein